MLDQAPAPSATEDRLMTPSEVADALRIDTVTLARWARNGDIESIQLPGGSHRRYRRSVIDAILAGSPAHDA